MPYALSFSEDFFIDRDPEEVRPSDWPTSVYQAILSMSQVKWNEIAQDVFHDEPNCLDPLAVLNQIRQTDTCAPFRSGSIVKGFAMCWSTIQLRRFECPIGNSRLVERLLTRPIAIFSPVTLYAVIITQDARPFPEPEE